jgi:hypothetical protein
MTNAWTPTLKSKRASKWITGLINWDVPDHIDCQKVLAVDELRQAKARDLQFASLVEQDIRGLELAVNDTVRLHERHPYPNAEQDDALLGRNLNLQSVSTTLEVDAITQGRFRPRSEDPRTVLAIKGK